MILLKGLFGLLCLVQIAKAYDYNPLLEDYTGLNIKTPNMKSTLDIFSDKDKDCPPCFNCMLPGFECLHFANCSEYDGKCNCPSGFGGNDCKQPCNVSFAVIMHKICFY
jgi:hypothetical protein